MVFMSVIMWNLWFLNRPMNNYLKKKELDTMCNLSYGIEEQGIEKGRLDLIKNMLSKHMPVEDIMKYSGATEEEIRKAEEQLCISK